jgi:hypothetical protein
MSLCAAVRSPPDASSCAFGEQWSADVAVVLVLLVLLQY